MNQLIADTIAFFTNDESSNDNISDAERDLTRIAYTLQMGREAMNARVAVIASSVDEMLRKLNYMVQQGGHSLGSYRHKGFEAQQIYLSNPDNQAVGELQGLITDEMIQLQMNLSIESANWQPVAKLWVNCVELPFADIWQQQKVKPVSLALYPFARERHWIDDASEVKPVAVALQVTPMAAKNVSKKEKPTSDTQWYFSLTDSPQPGEPLEKMMRFLNVQIANSLGGDASETASEVSLIDLGMDSVSVAELIHQVNQLLQERISPSVIFKYPEVQSFAGYLSETYQEQLSRVICSEHPFVGRVTANTSASVQNVAIDIMVPMHSEGKQRAIFALPGAGGMSLSLQQLSHALGDNQPFYCIEARGLYGDEPLLDTIEAMATDSIAAMEKVQPKGPYRLLGYSNGGVVAFEMVRQLLAKGQKVESLTLLDCLCPTARNDNPLDLVADIFTHFVSTLGGKIDVDVEKLKALTEDKRSDYLYQLIEQQGIDLPKDQFNATYKAATTSEADSNVSFQFEFR